MKYEVEIDVHAIKYMVVDAHSVDEAIEKAFTILEDADIPVKPEDMPDINIMDAWPVFEETK